jgi:hypothetical protein
VVCGGPYSGDNRGILVLIEDTDGDGLLDSSSRRMVVDSFDLGGGVGLACQPGTGDLYILARETQMVYKIEGVSPDVGGAFPPIRYDAFKERVPIPTFGRLPSPGDLVAEVFGTPGRVVSLSTTSPGPMVLLGSNSCGPSGLARIDLSAPLEEGQRCRLSDAAGLASPEFLVAPAPGSVRIDPTVELGSEFSLVLSGPPDLLLDLEQSASLDSWAKAGVVALDGWSRGGFPLPLDKQSPATQFLRAASPNIPILALPDTYTLVCPGVEFDFCVADNDLLPGDFLDAGGGDSRSSKA